MELMVEFTCCKPTCMLAADMKAAAAGELKYEGMLRAAVLEIGGECPSSWRLFVVGEAVLVPKQLELGLTDRLAAEWWCWWW